MRGVAPGIRKQDFARRRQQLMQMAGEDAIFILPAAPVRVRSRDTYHPYRQDSDFWYLTGFPEPEAVLVLAPGRREGASLLFCRARNPESEMWDGHRIGPQGAVDDYGMDGAFPIEDLDRVLPDLLVGRPRVFYHFGQNIDLNFRVAGWTSCERAKTAFELLEINRLLHELRLFKDASELGMMRRAAEVSVEAHIEAMRSTHPGAYEHEIEAVLQNVFRKHGAVPAYLPIVGGGDNACTLHYVDNRARLRDGDLLLIDAGAEIHGYAADISRCFPVSGRYSVEQREIYTLVLDAQCAALAEARPGKPWSACHQAAVTVLTDGLLRLGLLEGSLQGNLDSGAYRRFYMHKTGHWIGLDVHDVGEYFIDGESRMLQPGMVFTIEPALYIAPGSEGVAERWHGIGVRIEDDVAISSEGCEVLTRNAPRQIDEIEELLAER